MQERDKVGNRRYEEIEKAAKVLGLHDTATMNEIKENYRKLMIRWHPDICRENQKKCEEMVREIAHAYRIIIDYCNNYEYSFRREDLKRARSYKEYDEWWHERFGDDPIWGEGNRGKNAEG